MLENAANNALNDAAGCWLLAAAAAAAGTVAAAGAVAAAAAAAGAVAAAAVAVGGGVPLVWDVKIKYFSSPPLPLPRRPIWTGKRDFGPKNTISVYFCMIFAHFHDFCTFFMIFANCS